MRLVDVRHEQTAVFAAEATAKLTRRPGLRRADRRARASPTASAPSPPPTSTARRCSSSAAGPRRSAGAPAACRSSTTRRCSRRSPSGRPPCRRSATIAGAVDDALRARDRAAPRAGLPRRADGPALQPRRGRAARRHRSSERVEPGPRRPRQRSASCWPAPSARCWSSAPTCGPTAPRTPRAGWPRRPASRSSPTAWAAASCRPATRCSSPGPAAPPSAGPTWSSSSACRWTSGSASASSAARTAPRRRRSCTSPTPPASWPRHVELAGSAAGDLTAVLDGVLDGVDAGGPPGGVRRLDLDAAGRRARGRRQGPRPAGQRRRPDPPGAHLRRAGPPAGRRRRGDRRRRRLRVLRRQVRRARRRPAAGSTPAPTAAWAPASATRSAARLARPSGQVVLMLGDGAAGFSLMDVDTLVRHGLPVVMVMGNNGGWGLEKHPMRFLYGYDVAAELAPQTRYDEVVRALGGAGELVTRAGRDRPGAGPRVRRGRALPGQRRDRPGGRLPAQHQPGLRVAGRRVAGASRVRLRA